MSTNTSWDISMMRSQFFILFTLFLGHFFADFVSAEDSLKPMPQEVVREGGSMAPLPPGVPRLPEPGENARDIIVMAGNLEAFRPLLLAPLAAWIEDEQLLLRVVRRLDFPWRLSKEWQERSIENLNRYRLAADGGLTSVDGVDADWGGYPFGFARHIENEVDPAIKARKILWNSLFARAASKDLLYEAELNWIGAQSVTRQSEGIFYRKYFRPFSSGDTGAVSSPETTPEGGAEEAGTPAEDKILRKEVLQLTSPPVVYGYAQVSWRFRGDEEDALWLYSPVIAKSRTLLSSNRSDGLLGGLMTLDDLEVNSSKIQAVNARVVDEKVLLLPYSSFMLYPAELSRPSSAPGTPGASEISAAEDSTTQQKPSAEVLSVTGPHQRLDGRPTLTRWNHETKQITGAAPWIPMTAHFVPREVWIIEVLPSDPYYTTGREILVVDKESMLPAYKLVYDHYGNFQRLVIGGFGLAETKDEKVRFPFLGFLLVVDATGREATTFTPTAVRTFLGQQTASAEEFQRLFDIDNHSKTAEPESPQTSPNEGVPAVPGTPSVPDL